MGSASVSGVVSRKVLPACGGLCYFCPSLRARSRQPVKRYKKILAEIFPATQITEYLEQRCYKELRKEQYGFAKVVVLIYRRLLVSCKDQMKDAKDPNFWSRICVHNMAKLSREATTFRRVLESLFRHFDNNNSWSSLNTLALSVLLDMQMLMENSGQNMNLMISILVKHLEHKSVSKQPEVQLSIMEVIVSLAEQSRAQASGATIGAISDLVRHMKKTLQVAVGSRELELVKWNDKLRKAVDDCIVQLSKKVGDAGPVLGMMSVMLENISRTPLIAIATTSAVYRTAQIIASIPNLSYKNKVFPEVLFHQLLLAMVHPDHETRVSAHRIFSVVLVPSSVSPFPHSESPDQLKKQEIQRTLSRAVSVFSSSAALFDKLRRDKASFRENTQAGSRNKTLYGIGDETASPKNLSGSQSRRRSFRVPNLSIKRVPSSSLRSSVSLKESQNSSTKSCNEMVGTGTSSQAARYSVSTAPDMPFKDMTSQCEALSMGKQQKMSAFMSFKHSWQASIPENDPINHAEAAHIFDEQKNTNPFLQENYPTDGGAQTGGNLQQQHLLKLPASSPYDNFLKAAGC
ncbi:hypothetical protein ACQ4PT_018584 [Festuca glaucescens]